MVASRTSDPTLSSTSDGAVRLETGEKHGNTTGNIQGGVTATLIARGKVGKRGKGVVMLSAGVATEDGKSIAEAVGTFTILS